MLKIRRVKNERQQRIGDVIRDESHNRSFADAVKSNPVRICEPLSKETEVKEET